MLETISCRHSRESPVHHSDARREPEQENKTEDDTNPPVNENQGSKKIFHDLTNLERHCYPQAFPVSRIISDTFHGQGVQAVGAGTRQWNRDSAIPRCGDNDQGRFRFIAVEGWMDVRGVDRDGRAGVEFSWEGVDELDPACGRGWATRSPDGSLEGRILFHMGDDSSFRAEPETARPHS